MSPERPQGRGLPHHPPETGRLISGQYVSLVATVGFHFLAIFSMKMETSSNQSRLSQMHQTVNRN
jgi:hypothetical protein